MPSRALTLATVPQTYAQLKRAVLAVALKGRQEVENAWLLTYHEIGRLIQVHLQLNQARADYGAQAIHRLAGDTGMSERSLYECRHFFRCFPIPRKSAKLGWSHYVLLCQVVDATQREALAVQADRGAWSTNDLKARVRALNAIDVTPERADTARNVTPPKPLAPKRGTVGVFGVVASGGGPALSQAEGLAVDPGFTSYVDLPATTKLRAECFVRLGADGKFAAARDAAKSDLFTYRAEVIRVVDGDTLWMKIYLQPGRWVKEKLRLRGLDCPEMATPEGKAAKCFVEGLVAGAKSITITTFKPDKWDRYLSDVFLGQDGEGGRAQQDCAPTGEIFLNNHLLASGHARRMDEYALTDWEGE